MRFLGSDDFPPSARREAVEDLVAAVAARDLHIRITDPLPLEQIAQAHDAVDAGSRSRVLLAVDAG